jgi:hypothetical protein
VRDRKRDDDTAGEAARSARRRREGAGEAGTTRRRALLGFLGARESGFEELRRALGVSAGVLEEDLRHVDRTARAGGGRLVVEPAACRACGFAFHARVSRRYAAPGRCPRCRSERIEDTRLRILSRATKGGIETAPRAEPDTDGDGAT